MAKSKLLTLDKRGRISLGSLTQGNTMYLGHTEADGTIILVPATAVPLNDARLLRHPDVLDAIQRTRADESFLIRGRGRPVRKPRIIDDNP